MKSMTKVEASFDRRNGKEDRSKSHSMNLKEISDTHTHHHTTWIFWHSHAKAPSGQKYCFGKNNIGHLGLEHQ